MVFAVLFLAGVILMINEGYWFPVPNLIGVGLVAGAAYGATKRGPS